MIIYPDGFIKVTDLDELVTAFDDGALSLSQLKEAINSLHWLLEQLYAGKLSELLAPMERFDQ